MAHGPQLAPNYSTAWSMSGGYHMLYLWQDHSTMSLNRAKHRALHFFMIHSTLQRWIGVDSIKIIMNPATSSRNRIDVVALHFISLLAMDWIDGSPANMLQEIELTFEPSGRNHSGQQPSPDGSPRLHPWPRTDALPWLTRNGLVLWRRDRHAGDFSPDRGNGRLPGNRPCKAILA